MIKRIRLADRHTGISTWPADLPLAARPVRATVSTILPELTDQRVHCAVVEIAWFGGEDHLAEFEAAAGEREGVAGSVVVAEEVVLRGDGWLRDRWAGGGRRLKQIALARRDPALSAAEFSARWRAHAGHAGAARIPDRVRGAAYVQNHPLPGRDWAYDAVNEVYVDRLAVLRDRTEWLRAHPPGPGDLFHDSALVAVWEEPVNLRGRPAGSRAARAH